MFCEWWEVEDDGYICRLLKEGGQHDEILWLLSRLQWIAHRLVTGGLPSVERDIARGIEISDARHGKESEMRQFL